MKMHIKEFAKLTGVSVRTLHYYDEIGLLKPSAVDEQNGYRYYDEGSIGRMQEILFYRELDFPLKRIKEILSALDYDKQQAFKAQKHLLTLKRARLERLIAALDHAMKGEKITMNIFDNSEFEAQRAQYEKEANARWGTSSAYKEFAEKTKDYSNEQQNELAAGMNGIIAEFARCKGDGFAPQSDAAQALVNKWQEYISEHYYSCTTEILSGLGQMYAADARFKENIDRQGDGTAQFMSDAIEVYCR